MSLVENNVITATLHVNHLTDEVSKYSRKKFICDYSQMTICFLVG